MGDPTGGSIARITVSMLKRVAMAARSGPGAVSTAVEAIAAELGTSTAAVVRGIAVMTDKIATGAGATGWASTATTAVEGAVAEGALVTTETVVAAGATTAASGGVVTAGVTWFTGLTVAAQVAIAAAVIGGTILVAQGVGSMSGDSPSAVSGAGPGTTLFSGATLADFDPGYQVVGAYKDGSLKIVSVRGVEDLEAGIAWCNVRHGGVDCDTSADFRPLTPEVFDNATLASEALCGMLGGPYYSPALADGWVAPYGEGTVTLDDWGALDLSKCAGP